MAEVAHVEYGTESHILLNSNKRKNDVSPDRRHRSHISIPILLVEMFVATILKIYAENYFLSPIENLALSILASSMINDPSDCLSYATSCSVLYAVTFNAYHKLGSLAQINELLAHFGLSSDFTIPSIISGTIMGKPNFRIAIMNIAVLKWIEKYVQHLLYYISFHIVIFQFSQSILNPNYYEDKLKNSKKVLPNYKNETNRNTGQRVSSSGSGKPPPHTLHTNTAQQLNHANLSERINVSQSNFSSMHEYNNMSAINTSTSNLPNHPSQFSLKKNQVGSKNLPYFTGIVSEYELFEPSVISAAGSNIQAVTTNVTIPSPSGSREADNDTSQESYTNQFFEVKVDLDKNNDARDLKLDVTVTSNLENFIRHLFKRKNQHLIPPLWSMVVTLKTTNFEKKYLKEVKEVPLGPTISGSGSENEISENNISPTNSNSDNDELAQSVFNNLQTSGTMALIAQTALDDYAQLNIVSPRDNIFRKDDKDYKVCIVEIATNSIIFQIENLHEGELIVLVNGVIWSEVSCALILEHEGEELVVVGGLVPSCSYDIQFINRLSSTEDYLISDLMVRTLGNKDVSDKFENIDLSFPSYYHRKFLSPLLTLKHSVLTTNTNLAEGRAKLKKSKKEISKKLNTLRQDIDHFKAKISQNASNDGKSASKVDSLKVALQQSESTLSKLEAVLKKLVEEEVELEEQYLQQKDLHLRRQMEYSKLEESLDGELATAKNKCIKFQQDLSQLNSKKEKLVIRHEKLRKEVNQNTEEFESFKAQFLQKREKERSKRQEIRAREANEFEMSIKGLEQDISRLEGENGSMHKLMHGF